MDESTASAPQPAITFRVTLEDMVAWNRRFVLTSPAVRKARVVLTVVYPLLIFCIVFVVTAANRETGAGAAALFGLLAATATIAYFVYLFKWGYIDRIRKQVAKTLSPESSPGAIGDKRVEVREDGFTVQGECARTDYSWKALVRIDTEPGYSYVYVGAMTALVIPHHAITSGDLGAVMAVFNERLRLRSSPPL